MLNNVHKNSKRDYLADPANNLSYKYDIND